MWIMRLVLAVARRLAAGLIYYGCFFNSVAHVEIIRSAQTIGDERAVPVPSRRSTRPPSEVERALWADLGIRI